MFGEVAKARFVSFHLVFFCEGRCCVCVFLGGKISHIYLDHPRGAEWMIRGACTPSLRGQTAPFGRCW